MIIIILKNIKTISKKCPKCLKDKRSINSLNEFLRKSNLLHNNYYDYSNIKHNNFSVVNKVEIICPIHGSFIQIAEQHSNRTSCPKCTQENRKLTMEEFLTKAKIVHGDKYDYSEVDLNLVCNKIKIICPKHGSFLQRVHSHLYTKSGCPNCSKIISRGEIEWLDSLNVPNEYRNKRLNINGEIFFPDGYDPITNTIYEYYGDYWHGNLNIYSAEKINKISKMTFNDLYNRTIKREEIIKKAGYNLVTIWESDWKKIK